MGFERSEKVLFRHCDPAGIVFFPRYFEMMNDCVEAFFADALGMPFEGLHRTGAVPTARIETRFAAPSRHGDRLELRLDVTKVGRTSAAYRMTAHSGAELRFDTRATLVLVDANGRPAPWPAEVRRRLTDHLEPPT